MSTAPGPKGKRKIKYCNRRIAKAWMRLTLKHAAKSQPRKSNKFAHAKSHLWTVLAASCNVILGFGSSGLLGGLIFVIRNRVELLWMV